MIYRTRNQKTNKHKVNSVVLEQQRHYTKLEFIIKKKLIYVYFWGVKSFNCRRRKTFKMKWLIKLIPFFVWGKNKSDWNKKKTILDSKVHDVTLNDINTKLRTENKEEKLKKRTNKNILFRLIKVWLFFNFYFKINLYFQIFNISFNFKIYVHFYYYFYFSVFPSRL